LEAISETGATSIFGRAGYSPSSAKVARKDDVKTGGGKTYHKEEEWESYI